MPPPELSAPVRAAATQFLYRLFRLSARAIATTRFVPDPRGQVFFVDNLFNSELQMSLVPVTPDLRDYWVYVHLVGSEHQLGVMLGRVGWVPVPRHTDASQVDEVTFNRVVGTATHRYHADQLDNDSQLRSDLLNDLRILTDLLFRPLSNPPLEFPSSVRYGVGVSRVYKFVLTRKLSRQLNREGDLDLESEVRRVLNRLRQPHYSGWHCLAESAQNSLIASLTVRSADFQDRAELISMNPWLVTEDDYCHTYPFSWLFRPTAPVPADQEEEVDDPPEPAQPRLNANNDAFGAGSYIQFQNEWGREDRPAHQRLFSGLDHGFVSRLLATQDRPVELLQPPPVPIRPVGRPTQTISDLTIPDLAPHWFDSLVYDLLDHLRHCQLSVLSSGRDLKHLARTVQVRVRSTDGRAMTLTISDQTDTDRANTPQENEPTTPAVSVSIRTLDLEDDLG